MSLYSYTFIHVAKQVHSDNGVNCCFIHEGNKSGVNSEGIKFAVFAYNRATVRDQEVDSRKLQPP